MKATEPRDQPSPPGPDTAVAADVSWLPDRVDAYLPDARTRHSTTINRDGREIEALLDWLARSPEAVSGVEVGLHEENPTHEPLVDGLTQAGWQVKTQRYVFPGCRSSPHDGVQARIWVAGQGWVRGEFSVGRELVSLEASNVLDNGWQHLLDALSELLTGSRSAVARWWEEPYYAHFRFTQVDSGRVGLVIVREDFDKNLRAVTEQVLLDTTVSLVGIASAVAESSRALLDGYPHSELGQRWRHLPVAAQHRLDEALELFSSNS